MSLEINNINEPRNKAIEPIRDEDSVFGWVCGYCCYPVAYTQKYCEECGNPILWTDEVEKNG